MAPRRLAALFLAIAVALVLPSISLAASAGLVPCGVGSNTTASTECQACNLVQLVQSIITFLIGLSVPIAMAMFAYAGFLYFTSGAGGSENISKAKGIFRNSLIGFALALCSWLIVNTILVTVLNSNTSTGGFAPGSWFHVSCETRNPGSSNVGDVITQHLEPVQTIDLSQQTVNAGCAQGQLEEKEKGGVGCYDTNGNLVGSPTVQNTLTHDGVGNCAPALMQSTWGSNAQTMSCIAQQESSCGANPTSRVDVTPAGQPISVGLYQINMSANKILCPNQAPLNCPAAFSGALTGSHQSISVKSDAASQKLYNDCLNAALNTTCNTQTAISLFNNSKGVSNWSTAGLCGY